MGLDKKLIGGHVEVSIGDCGEIWEGMVENIAEDGGLEVLVMKDASSRSGVTKRFKKFKIIPSCQISSITVLKCGGRRLMKDEGESGGGSLMTFAYGTARHQHLSDMVFDKTEATILTPSSTDNGTVVTGSIGLYGSRKPMGLTYIPHKFQFINKIGPEFSSICSQLRKPKNNTVSLNAEGHRISRDGELYILSIGTESHVYMFDVKRMGRSAFDYGLREILENKQIRKITFRCNFLSDCLAHVYSVKLRHVSDVQIGFWLFWRNTIRYRDETLEVNYLDLQTVLRRLLKWNQDAIYDYTRNTRTMSEIASFGKRPLSPRHLNATLKDLIYLRHLDKVIHTSLLNEYHMASRISLDDLRALPIEVAAIQPYYPVPVRFCNQALQVKDFQDNAIAKMKDSSVERQDVDNRRNIEGNAEEIRSKQSKKVSDLLLNSKGYKDFIQSRRTQKSSEECFSHKHLNSKQEIPPPFESAHKCPLDSFRLG